MEESAFKSPPLKELARDMRDYYFDDLKPGKTFTSPSLVLTEQDMIEFAKVYDPQPFHLDRNAAKASVFGGLVAGGFQTAALTWALAQRTGVFRKSNLAGLGVDGLRWRKPVRAGDALTCRFEVLKKRKSLSRPGQGIVEWRFDVYNQRDEIVLTMRMSQLLKCREVPQPGDTQTRASLASLNEKPSTVG
jgi:acyl dehydratase